MSENETQRQRKVSKLLQRELADIFQREASNLYKPALVTIGYVKVTPDLGSAYVYVSIFNAKNNADVINDIQERKTYFKQLLVKRIRNQFKFMPELKFFEDDTLEETEKLDEIFSKIDIPTEEEARQRDEELQKQYRKLDD